MTSHLRSLCLSSHCHLPFGHGGAHEYEDVDDVILCETIEEAIAVAKVGAEPGQEIEIHELDCGSYGDGEWCTCEPRVVVMGERIVA